MRNFINFIFAANNAIYNKPQHYWTMFFHFFLLHLVANVIFPGWSILSLIFTILTLLFVVNPGIHLVKHFLQINK